MQDTLKPIDSVEKTNEDMVGSLDDQLDDLSMAAENAYEKRQRFVLMMDATSSMQSVINMAKEALKYAVDEIQKRSTVPVQCKAIVYRDHESEDDKRIVEESDWSDDSQYLKEWIGNVRAFGGGDYPESIGHGLRVILQQPVNQIILVGDAPSKPGSTGYEEAKAFGAQKCPIYAMYTNEERTLVACFQKLAQLSGGKAFYLRNEESMADIFTLLLASNKALAIEYMPTTDEGRRMKKEMGL